MEIVEQIIFLISDPHYGRLVHSGGKNLLCDLN